MSQRSWGRNIPKIFGCLGCYWILSKHVFFKKKHSLTTGQIFAICNITCLLIYFSFFFYLCKSPRLVPNSQQYHDKKRTGLFFTTNGKKFSIWKFWTPRCLLSSPSFPRSSGVEIYWTVTQSRSFPEAMSVAVKLGNGHWIAVRPQNCPYQCYQWSGLLATKIVWDFPHRSTSCHCLISLGWAKQCLGNNITVDLFSSDGVIGFINCHFGIV